MKTLIYREAGDKCAKSDTDVQFHIIYIMRTRQAIIYGSGAARELNAK